MEDVNPYYRLIWRRTHPLVLRKGSPQNQLAIADQEVLCCPDMASLCRHIRKELTACSLRGSSSRARGPRAGTCALPHFQNGPIPLGSVLVSLATDRVSEKKKRLHNHSRFFSVGIVLSSRSVARQVFSPPMSLTSVFGMGTGGPSPL